MAATCWLRRARKSASCALPSKHRREERRFLLEAGASPAQWSQKGPTAVCGGGGVRACAGRPAAVSKLECVCRPPNRLQWLQTQSLARLSGGPMRRNGAPLARVCAACPTSAVQSATLASPNRGPLAASSQSVYLHTQSARGSTRPLSVREPVCQFCARRVSKGLDPAAGP